MPILYLILFLSQLLDNNHHQISTNNNWTNLSPELLLIDNDTFYLYTDFVETSPLKNLYGYKKYKDKLIRQYDTSISCSNCPREFTGIWLLKDKRLYLFELRQCCSDEAVPLSYIFKPRHIGKYGVKAFWVDDTYLAHEEYHSIYDINYYKNWDNHTELKFKKGKLIQKTIRTSDE